LGRGEGNGLAPRLTARLADLTLSLASLETALRSGEADESSSGCEAGSDAGYGVVESARGRLYHLAQISSRGRIGAYRILAPTEWNFHANGPFVANVLGARLPRGGRGRLSLERLAALFDPCVGFEVSVREFADA
jgi:coenzyme F420-reducing hydrogenase alpha subunit